MTRAVSKCFLFLLLAMSWLSLRAEVVCQSMVMRSGVQRSHGEDIARLKSLIEELIQTGRLSTSQVQAIMWGGSQSGLRVETVLAERALRQTLQRVSLSDEERSALLSQLEGEFGDSRGRDQVMSESAFLRRMVFHQIDYGARSFELMETPVTREMWWVVMGASPKGDPDFRPDLRPVTFVNSEEVEEFVKQLNKKLKEKEPTIFSLVRDHTDEFEYRLVGGREFVSISGLILDEYGSLLRTGLSDAPLKKGALAAFVWNIESGQGTDRPEDVATKLPMVLQEKPFFDLLGNVDELYVDSEDPQLAVHRLEHPRAFWRGYCAWGGHILSVSRSFEARVFRGDQFPDVLQKGIILDQRPGHPLVGFRLVRVRK